MKKNTVLKLLSNLDAIVSSAVLLLLIVLTFAGVIWRRIFNAPFTWMEEVQLACLVWIVFGAGGLAFRTGNHVAIEMIVDLFSEKWQKIMTILISIVVVMVLGYLLKQSLGFIDLFIRSSRSTSILKIPYWLIYGIAPISYIVMVISYFFSIINGVQSEAKEAINE